MAPPLSPYTNGIMPNFGVTVPPGDALNTTEAEIKGGIQPTFFADGCRFYVEASSVNGLISEILNAVNCAGLSYDPDRLDNLCLAMEAMSQGQTADQIAALICADASAKSTLQACLVDNLISADVIANAICADTSAKETLQACLVEDFVTPEFIVNLICSDTGDNGGDAGTDLAGCLISNFAGNQLTQAVDGLLYVGPGDTPPPVADGFGYGQEWQNMLGSRQLNTVYHNTSTKPIMWSAAVAQLQEFTGPGSTNFLMMIAQTSGGAYVPAGAGPSNGSTVSTVVVPPGHYYKVEIQPSQPWELFFAKSLWSELR